VQERDRNVGRWVVVQRGRTAVRWKSNDGQIAVERQSNDSRIEVKS